MQPVTTLPDELPEKTLGWAVLAWCDRFIRQPDGPRAGDEFRFTREQVAFVLNWYAVDSAGRFLYSRGCLRRAKGWGKSPLVAALSLAELCGPVRFGGWWPDGEPVAVEENAPLVQLAGVSEKQTSNTLSLVLAMCRESPIVDEYGLDLGLTRIYTSAGGRLEPITASAPTAEGARPTFVVEDETHHWTETNGGHALDRVNRRNVGKRAGGTARVLETTNAHAPGENSVAEKTFDAWRAAADGRLRRTSLLYDSREAPAGIELSDEASLREGLKCAYGDSTWLDEERLLDEIFDPSTPPSDSFRFYLNILYQAADAWIASGEWDRQARPGLRPPPGTPVTLGFDGSIRDDATALVGCEVDTGHLFLIGCWEKPVGPAGDFWQVPREAVDAAVAEAFATWTVVAFYADPPNWQDYLDRWTGEFGDRLQVRARGGGGPLEFWTNRSSVMVAALERFHVAVVAARDGEAGLTHDGDPTLTRHVLNARRRAGRAGITIAKEHPSSDRKIDAAMAAVLAYEARSDVIAVGGVVAQKSKRLVTL